MPESTIRQRERLARECARLRLFATRRCVHIHVRSDISTSMCQKIRSYGRSDKGMLGGKLVMQLVHGVVSFL